MDCIGQNIPGFSGSIIKVCVFARNANEICLYSTDGYHNNGHRQGHIVIGLCVMANVNVFATYKHINQKQASKIFQE